MASPPIVIQFKGKVENLDDVALSVRVLRKPTESHIVFPSRTFPNFRIHCSNSVMISLRDRLIHGSSVYLTSPLILDFNGKTPVEGSVATVTLTLGNRDLWSEYRNDMILLNKNFYAMPYEESNPSLLDLERKLNEAYCLKARHITNIAMGNK